MLGRNAFPHATANLTAQDPAVPAILSRVLAMGNAMNEPWRAQQDAATRFTESWRDLLRPPADRAPRTPAPP